MSNNIEIKIKSYGYDNKLFHKFWRKFGSHCKLSFRESNYVFVFKDETRKDQFINEVKSLEFNQSLKNSLYTKKNEYIFLLEEIEQILNVLKKKTSDQSLSLRSYLKVSEKKIKKVCYYESTLRFSESGNSLFKIVRIKN